MVAVPVGASLRGSARRHLAWRKLPIDDPEHSGKVGVRASPTLVRNKENSVEEGCVS
jgi:hypothetical protein